MGDSKILQVLAIAVIARLALKTIDFIPSVEPIIPLAVIAGLTISAEAGFTVGAAGFILSNLVLDAGFGYWTILQALGAGLAGALPAFIKTKKKNSDAVVGFAIVGTVIYEFFVNMPDGMIFVMPFSAIHVVSSIVLGFLFASMFSLKKTDHDAQAGHDDRSSIENNHGKNSHDSHGGQGDNHDEHDAIHGGPFA
ncbi:MAG: hypothetical protein COT15_01030 [Candidatus Diapherotrites archaeon CG08_land_8_20_14_0_20_34_12]|nr:MAG: hypothetical protein COT15_01030 [Candidatus Diapherotrites archaeon CG08_land_8_20_14_0_20_34_12]